MCNKLKAHLMMQQKKLPLVASNIVFTEDFATLLNEPSLQEKPSLVTHIYRQVTIPSVKRCLASNGHNPIGNPLETGDYRRFFVLTDDLCPSVITYFLVAQECVSVTIVHNLD